MRTRTKPRRYFYPRPLRGGRRRAQGGRLEEQIISIHALCEEGDSHRDAPVTEQRHFYPRPPRGGRRVFLDEDQSDILISIHALREEGDRVRFLRSSQRHNFYPRPPRGGRRPASSSLLFRILFLSTPSARRATSSGLCNAIPNFISIHALREEGDTWPSSSLRSTTTFLSTPSARRATSTVPGHII